MRLPIIPPDRLSVASDPFSLLKRCGIRRSVYGGDEQKVLAADMKEGIAKSFQGFVNIRDDGALLGPWNPWLQEPKFGKPVWELTKAMAD